MIRTLGFAPTIFPKDFVGCIIEGFIPSKKTLKPDTVPFVFVILHMPPTKQRKTGATKIVQAAHYSIVSELLNREPSQQELEFEPLNKVVGIQCG